MKLILLLTKIRLLSLVSSVLNIGRKKRPQKKMSPLLIVGITVLLVYIAVSFIGLVTLLSIGVGEMAIVQLKTPWFYFSLIFTLAFAMMVFTGSFTAKAQIFSPKDNDLLLSMPIPSRAILISRMSLLYVSDLFFCMLFSLPAGVIYLLLFGSYIKISVLGILSYLLTVLLLPLPALAISCILGWLICALESRFRNKAAVQAVPSMLFLALYFFVCFRFNEIISYMLTNGEAVIHTFMTSLYPIYAMGAAAAEGSVLMLALTLVFCILPFALCFIILERSFIRLTVTKLGPKKLKYSRDMSQTSSMRSPLGALTVKEIRHFFSNSMYMMNAGIGLVLLLIGSVALPFLRGGPISMLTELGSDTAAAIIMLPGLYLISMTLISAPSVSLEGKNLWISLALPVRSCLPLHAKTLSHIIISAIPVFIFSLSCLIFLPMSFLCGVFIVLIPQAFSAVVAMLGSLINARFPKFDWIDEMVAVKQSVSVLLTMLVSFALLALCIAVALPFTLMLSVTVGMFATFAVLVALGIGLYFIEDRAGARLFAALGNR